MKLIHNPDEMRGASRAARVRGARVGLVPTMGALHKGHLSLVRAAREWCDFVAASIFVNPTQFGPNEDFSKYPRNLDRDCQMLEKEGLDVLFAPNADEMYPAGSVTWVEVEKMSERLCGKSRPGHFRGVTTVVAKLFNIVEPDAAFFGQKDAAQVAIIKRMVRDLNMAVEIQVCPIIREADGLAMSSRNAYLNSQERKSALVLYRSMLTAKNRFDAGERDASTLIDSAKAEFARNPEVRLDYFEIVDPDTLDPEPAINKRVLIAVAAFVGNTRLIDNILLEP